MECHLRREKQLLLAGLSGLEGARVLWAGAQQLFWVSKVQRLLVAGTGDCQRHFSGCRDLSVALALPSLPVATSSQVSHLELAAAHGSDCSPAHSCAVLAVLPPHLKSSNWLFGSLYTKFKLLALTS